MFWFNFNCGFSGQKYFTEGAIQMFNLIFTSLPILFYAAADKDLPVELVYRFPGIYKACIDGAYFTSVGFWRWVITAVLESVVISVLALYFLENAKGYSLGFWASGALNYTVIIFVVNIKVCVPPPALLPAACALPCPSPHSVPPHSSCPFLLVSQLFNFQTQWTWQHLFLLFISILSWFLVAIVINVSVSLSSFDWYNVFFALMSTGDFWMTLLWLVVLLCGWETFVDGVRRAIFYEPLHILQEVRFPCLALLCSCVSLLLPSLRALFHSLPRPLLLPLHLLLGRLGRT